MTKRTDIEPLLVSPQAPIRAAMAAIDRTGSGIVLVVDDDRHLLGTVTDGDIRRAILDGTDLDSPVSRLFDAGRPEPVTARVGADDPALLHLMNENGIRHIPLLGPEGRVVDLALLSEIAREYEAPLSAVVMAGGFGSRLRPLTEDLPKPMLPVGDRPLLEWALRQLRSAGVSRVSLTTHYKPEVIVDHFGDGSDFDIEIGYVNEDQPLGTAGALGLLEEWDEPLLVMNGDILTGLDFRALLEYHRAHRGDATVAVSPYQSRIPYGVVEMKGDQIARVVEKPTHRHFVVAGIYVLSPSVREFIPQGEHLDMTELVEILISAGRRVLSFPIREYWRDIGAQESYEQALEDVAAGPWGEQVSGGG